MSVPVLALVSTPVSAPEPESAQSGPGLSGKIVWWLFIPL